MKAADYVESELRFPYMASVKLDGFRCFVHEGVPLTSSGAPIANDFTRGLFTETMSTGRAFEGLDGELIVGAWNDPKAFKNTSGPVRKKTGEPDVRFYVFDDRTRPNDTFVTRYANAVQRVLLAQQKHRNPMNARIEVIPQVMVRNLEELYAFEREAIANNFEGIMLADPEGPYKFGRSTLKENWRLKVKRFVTEEAEIIGFKERMINDSESFEDELGRLKKSEKAEDRRPSGMVGAFTVRSSKWAVEFDIQATTLSHEEAKEALERFDELYRGQLASFEYFPHGVVDRPRHALFRAIRGREDMTE